MRWAVSAQLLNGADGKLMPRKSASRAECAAILMRWDGERAGAIKHAWYPGARPFAAARFAVPRRCAAKMSTPQGGCLGVLKLHVIFKREHLFDTHSAGPSTP